LKLELITQEPASSSNKVPILFVHGMWHSAWCWTEKFMPYFAKRGYLTHALSLRGHGMSEGKDKLRWASIDDYVDDVAQVVSKMEKAPILVGHSMGGMVLQKYLESHKAPSAVLLASAPPNGVLKTSFRVACRYPIPFLKANFLLSLYPVVGSLERCRELFYSSDIPEEELSLYFSRLQDESYRAYLDLMFLNLPSPDSVDTRILVLGAAQDSLVNLADINRTAAAYNAEKKIFDSTAHNMMLEPNWRAVADCIIEWIENIVELGDEKGLA
jgi:pimeloyl-ACP methyl ester carboxylesterase